MENVSAKNLRLFVDYDCWEKIYLSQQSFRTNSQSPEETFAEIKKYLIRYKIRKFEFVNPCNLNLSVLGQVCTLIIRSKLDIEWSALAIVNPNMDLGILDKIKRAGCKKLIFELFSGSDSLLNKIGAKFTAEQASRILRICHQVDIATGIKLILGHPQETQDSFNRTIDFLTKNINFIDEMTKITYCLSSYFYSDFLPLPLCYNWVRCFGCAKREKENPFQADYLKSLSKILSLGKPVIYIEPDKSVFDYLKKLDRYRLRHKKFVLCFDNGKCRLFWQGTELTMGLGLYSSIFAAGFWQDSEHAKWQVTKINEARIIAKGRWQRLPIIQVWQIELKDEITISLKIEMEVLEQTTIEGEQQVNIMLSNKYSKWSFNGDSCGLFPDIFNEDWPTLSEKDRNLTSTIRAETNSFNDQLPFLLLRDRTGREEYRMAVLNASSAFKARVLKCYKVDSRKYSPGRYLYFEGEIIIGDLK